MDEEELFNQFYKTGERFCDNPDAPKWAGVWKQKYICKQCGEEIIDLDHSSAMRFPDLIRGNSARAHIKVHKEERIKEIDNQIAELQEKLKKMDQLENDIRTLKILKAQTAAYFATSNPYILPIFNRWPFWWM